MTRNSSAKKKAKEYSRRLREQQKAARSGAVASAGTAMGVVRPGRANRSGLAPARRRSRTKMLNPCWRTEGPIGEVITTHVDPVTLR